MLILVAPDSYKGSVSAVSAANAIDKGIKKVFPDAAVIKIPIADGGEGTVEALVSATGGQILYEQVRGPLGDIVTAHWGILGDEKTAVIEMASASGLPLVPLDKRDPRYTTTYGTGQLIKAALNKGLKRIIIGIGGSATNDGGTGMARALGVKFLDKQGKELEDTAEALLKLADIDISGLDKRIQFTEIKVACDVDNPLCGLRGASAVYGPQKGATPDMVQLLDKALKKYSQVAAQVTGKNVAEVPGAGAAGGLGAGLMFFTNAVLERGVNIILEATAFESKVSNAHLVITGEGRTDFQTVFGKAPIGVAKLAKKYNVPVVCLSGGLGEGADKVLANGIDAIMSIVPGPMSIDKCISSAETLIEEAAFRLGMMLKVGNNIKAVL